MSRTRRLVLHALIIAGFMSFAVVFATMSIGSSVPELSYAAVVASVIVAASFAVPLAAILREGTRVAAPSSASSTPKADWRTGSLGAWLIVSFVAAISERLGGSSPDERGLISTLGFAVLIALFAWQAIRVAKMEQQLHSS